MSKTKRAYIKGISEVLKSQKDRGSFLHRRFTKLIKDGLSRAFVAEVELVDSGYDLSSWGRRSKVPVDATRFATINNFLEYPTGDSVPTHVSGSGMAAETWEERLYYDWIEIVKNAYNAVPLYEEAIHSGLWNSGDLDISIPGNRQNVVCELDDELCDELIADFLLEEWRGDPMP